MSKPHTHFTYLEDLGFFEPGDGYKGVEEGLTKLGGTMPINTSRWVKCKGHPVGATGIAQLYEVWTQLKGRAGKRQLPIKDLRIGAPYNLGRTGVPVHLLILKGDEPMEIRPFSDISYEQFLREEKLMGSRCKKCGALFVLHPLPLLHPML